MGGTSVGIWWGGGSVSLGPKSCSQFSPILRAAGRQTTSLPVSASFIELDTVISVDQAAQPCHLISRSCSAPFPYLERKACSFRNSCEYFEGFWHDFIPQISGCSLSALPST